MYLKGSISSEILTEALKYLDQLNVFERRQDGPTPFGLLDGHGSRLQLPFLEYINSSTPDEQRKWMFTLGTPNATDVVGRWIRHALSVSIYVFSSWIGMWNRLVTPSIDDREGINRGGEGTSAKEENGGREWLFAEVVAVDEGVAVGL